MIPYIFHASILLSGSFIFYWLFLRKETFFHLNRWILVGSIVLSLALPFLTVPPQFSLHEPEIIYPYKSSTKDVPEEAMISPLITSTRHNQPIININPLSKNENFSGHLPIVTRDKITTGDEVSGSSMITLLKEKLNWTSVMWYSYIAGVLIFSIVFFIQFFSLLLKIVRLPGIQDGKFRIISLKNKAAPFSFLNCIFINPDQYDSETYELIIAHEKIHIQQVHFFDKLLAEVLLIAFWFNPFVWFYRNVITNNLEYLTDKSLLDKGVEKPTYQMSLLKVAVPNVALNITTNYNHSFLKNRITMMNSSKSSLSSSWKYMALIPIFILSLFTLNAVEQQYAPIEKKVENKTENAEEARMLLAALKANSRGEALSLAEEITENEASTNEQALEIEIEELDNYEFHLDSTRKEKIKVKNKDKDKNKSKNKNKTKEKEKTKLGPGEWEGEFEKDQLCLTLNNSNKERSWNSQFAKCFPINEFTGLSVNDSGAFSLVREAGKIDFSGTFSNKKGKGEYIFTENDGFKQFLGQQGISADNDHDLFYLFVNNINKDYINFLKQSAFEVDMDGLMALSVHTIDKEELKSFMQLFESLNNKDYTLEDLVHFKIHKVTPAYVNELRALGMNLDTDNIVMAKIHDIEPSYIKSMLDYGFKDADMEEMVQFAIHKVTLTYIDEMKALGFSDLGTDEIVAASIHKVDPQYIAEVRSLGFTDLDLDDIIQFSIHKITVDKIKALKSSGLKNLSKDDMIMAAIHNVDVAYIDKMKAMGFGDLDMEELIQFAIHKVTINYINEMKALGFSDLGTEEIVAASIHKVDPQYIAEVRSLGFTDLDLDDIIQFSIHKITVDKIKALKSSGLKNLSKDDMIMAAIHNVDVAYIDKMKAMGFGDLDMEELVQFAIHKISPEYIRAFQNAGIGNVDNEDIIKFEIHGISVDYIKAMQATGMKNLNTEEIVQFGIHNITPDYINAIYATKVPGIDKESIIQASIHNLQVSYIKDMQASGLTINDFTDIIRANMHSVSLDYIRQAQQAGFKDKDLNGYTNRKLRGM